MINNLTEADSGTHFAHFFSSFLLVTCELYNMSTQLTAPTRPSAISVLYRVNKTYYTLHTNCGNGFKPNWNKIYLNMCNLQRSA